jgi:hypothetical protein
MFLILQVVIVFLVAASMSLSLAHRRAGGLFRNRFIALVIAVAI